MKEMKTKLSRSISSLDTSLTFSIGQMPDSRTIEGRQVTAGLIQVWERVSVRTHIQTHIADLVDC